MKAKIIAKREDVNGLTHQSPDILIGFVLACFVWVLVLVRFVWVLVWFDLFMFCFVWVLDGFGFGLVWFWFGLVLVCL